MRSAQKGGRFRVTRCHSFFLSSVPEALTQLGAALHFYGVTFRYAASPQAKGKIERSHQDWQNRLPALCAAEAISTLEPLNALPLGHELGAEWLAELCLHRDTHERHRELAMTPCATPQIRSAPGRPPKRKAAPHSAPPHAARGGPASYLRCGAVEGLRSTVTVAPDGRVAAGACRLRVQVPQGTRLVHCLHPNANISVLRHKPSHDAKPQLLPHLPATI